MPKTFRPYELTRCCYRPSGRDWVPAGDLAHFINDALDLSAIEEVYAEVLRGYPPYHPR